MIIVRGTAHFEDGEIDRLRPQLEAYVQHVRALDGCIDYCYAVDIHNPNSLHVIESWRDEAANDAYMSDLGTLMEILAGAKMEGLTINAYEGRFLKRLIGD